MFARINTILYQEVAEVAGAISTTWGEGMGPGTSRAWRGTMRWRRSCMAGTGPWEADAATSTGEKFFFC